jgi:L-arabinokinase
MAAMLAVYVSGHGYGHATRVGEVLRAVREREPRLPIAIVTSGPELLYRRAVPGPFEFRAEACDTGLAQKSALVIDEAGTVDAWRRFPAGYAERVARETGWLRERHASVVLGDIPPLAFDAAADAGVASIALANFSWDWIYRHFAARQPALHEAADRAAAAYARAGLLLELPFAGDLSAFPRRESIPLVARRPNVARDDARRRLGFDGVVALISFGGLGLPGFDPAVLVRMPAITFVVSDAAAALPGNVRVVGAPEMQAAGVEYVDLVGAADVVVTKPGYGIVTDAIATGTRMVYTDRGDFPEYPILVAEMAQWLAGAYVTNAQLLGGDFEGELEDLLARPMPPPPPMDGARVAAERILEKVGRAWLSV